MKRENAQVSRIQDPGVPPPLPSKAKCVQGISWKSNGDKVVKDKQKKQMSTIEKPMKHPLPGDSKWPFCPLVEGHLAIEGVT